MATRATIAITDTRVSTTLGPKVKCYYNHWDGYVTGLGLELIELIEKNFCGDNSENTLRYAEREFPKKFEDIEEENVGEMGSEFAYIVWIKDEEIVIEVCYNILDKEGYADGDCKVMYRARKDHRKKYRTSLIDVEDV